MICQSRGDNCENPVKYEMMVQGKARKQIRRFLDPERITWNLEINQTSMAEGVTTIEIGAGESISASTMNSVAPLDSSSSVVQLDPAQPLVLNPTPTPVVAAPVPIKYKTSTAAATAAKREKRLERERLQGIASISLNNANALALAIEREANAAPGNPYENPETLVAKASTGSANWNALLKRARTQRIPSWDWGTAQYVPRSFDIDR